MPRTVLRRVAGWLPAVVLVPTALTTAVLLTRPTDKVAAIRPDRPLDPGTTWTYAVHDHAQESGTLTAQVVGTAELLGDQGVVSAYHVQDAFTDFAGQGPRTTSTYLTLAGHTLHQEGVIGPAHAYAPFDPALVAYDRDQAVGHARSYRGTLGSRDFQESTTLVARGSVTVSGTTIEDCSHYTTRIAVPATPGVAGSKATEEVLDEWDCPGLGPVRMSDRYDPTDFLLSEDLLEFHGVARSWVSADGPAPRTVPRAASSAMTSGSSVGFGPARTYATTGRIGPALAWADERTTVASFPPVSDGAVQITAEPDGDIAARDLTTGAARWQVRLEGPILVTPAIADGTVVVADARRRLWALSTEDGHAQWVHGFNDVVSASPVVTAGRVAVATDDGRLTVLDLAHGTTDWATSLEATAVGAPAAEDGRLAVGDTGGNLTVFDLATGHQDWSTSIPGGLAAGPVLAGSRLLVPDDEGVVSSYDSGTGRLQWETHSHGIIDAPISVGSGVVAVTVGGVLDVSELSDGHRRWSRHVAGPGRPPVVLVGDQLVTVSQDGQVSVLGLADGRTERDWRLPLPVRGARLRVEVSPGLVDGAVVVSASVQGSSLLGSVLYAYPTADVSTAGVLLGLHPRRVASPSTESAIEDGGDLLLPGLDQALHRTDAQGHDHVLLRDQGLATGATVAGGLVIARQDDHLVAVRPAGGDPVWSVPAGDSAFGAAPASWHDRLYVGTSTGSLEAISTGDGSVRWRSPTMPGSSPTTPLALPDGDVVYGGGLARYDGDTGRQEWALPDAKSFSTPAYSDGVVVAQLTRATHQSGVYAVDAATGKVLWSHADQPPSYTGPVIGDGYVVSVDTDGTVTAYDLDTGTVRWTLAMGGQAGGTPYVVGDRVLLVQLGRYEDLAQRDYRVSVHDLRTGAYLGSWQPPGAVLQVGPVVGPGDHGDLLVPTSAGEPLVVEVTPDG